MIPDGLLHDRENNELSQSHLKDNGKKFNRHCVEVLKLLYQGKRLHARQLETEYFMDGRRLRDIFAARKDCKRKWIRGADGVTRHVEYWLEIPPPPTKAKVVSMWQELIQTKGNDIPVYTAD